MVKIKLIVCVDENWGIGKDNKLLEYLPEDLKRFKNITDGNKVIMGRKTLESLPNGKPLKGRENIVLTRDKSYKNKDVTIKHSIKDVLEYLEGDYSDVYVIGGGQIYKTFNKYCSKAYITKIQKEYKCDTHICNFDNLSEWGKYKESECIEYEGIKYRYMEYYKDKEKTGGKDNC